MALTPRSVFRYYETDGVPASGPHKTKKAEVIQLLEQMAGASTSPAVVKQTKADLNAVTPTSENYGGLVLNDPDPTKNGYYYRDSAAWVKGRGLPDSIAEVTLAGTANAQTGTASGISPADVVTFFAVVGAENTGPMTLSIAGETARDVVNSAGNALSAGEWTGVVLFFVNDDGDYQLLIDAGAAASASASATAAALAFASLDTRYLGAKATDPTTDNAGGVLETGALYFNTTDGKFRVWTEADVWQDQSTALTDGEVTEPKLAAGGVSTRALADDSVTLAKLSAEVLELLGSSDSGWAVAELPTDGTTDCVSALQAAIDAASDHAVLIIPPGTYAIKSIPNDTSTWWTEGGDASLDLPSDAAIAIKGRKSLTVMAHGAKFIVDAVVDGFAICFYKSANCIWIGGEFVGNATLQAGTGQAASIAIIRCLNTWVEDAIVVNFYRNLFGYRSSFCGFRRCRSLGAGYMNIYAAGTLDANISGEDNPPLLGVVSAGFWLVDACHMQGAKYANAFSQDAEWENCHFINPGRQGVAAAQLRAERGYNAITGGSAIDTSNQNTGDVVDGFLISPGSDAASALVYPTGNKVVGVRMRGHRIAIDCVGLLEPTIQANDIAEYYQCGIAVLSRVVGSDTYPMDGANIIGNRIGPIKAGSSVVPSSPYKKAGIHLGRFNSARYLAVVAFNQVNVNDRGSRPVSGTWYEVAVDDLTATLEKVFNQVKGTGTNQLA